MTNPTNRPTGESSSQEGFPMERELIVVAKREAQLRVTREGITSVEGANVNSLADILASESAVMRPLFGINEEQIQARIASVAAETNADVPDLSLYYRVEAPDERLEALAARLREQEVVEAAYVKPAAEPPIALDQVSEMFHHMVPLAEEAPPVSPDFTVRQGYLDAAPGGIDARYAWTQSGSGAGVGIIDIERAWRFTHEDLRQNQGGVVGGTQSTDLGWRNHGTAVVGEFGSDRNTFGCTGICPDANVRAISTGKLGSAQAIRLAADMLNPGDIILIELHRPGHHFTGIGHKGFIAIEWWPDDFDAIRYASSRGVIVVEAAGNGAENLDDPIYNTPNSGFPSNWTNPFNRTNRDSGAIVVGAGAPPPNTHGRDHGPDRSRLDFSNYGSLIDAQGWGREVTTCGYGDLQGGSDEDLWYTDRFSGTSSASPIVVGALACLQSILRSRGRSPVSPAVARNLLRSTGSPQQDAPGRPRNQRIGNRPNIREMLALAELIGSSIFQIKSKHSGKFLDLDVSKGPHTINGTNVHQWDWHGGNSQKWILTVQGDGSYQIKSKHSGKCLDLYAPKGSHTTNGTNVQQWDWYGTNNQKWILTFQDDGSYQITSKHSGKCLDLDVSKGSHTINGTNVQQWDWHGGNNQKWILTSQDDGSYQITSKHSSKCLDLDVSKRLHTINGTNVQQWDWYGTNNQKWILIPST